MKTIVNLIRIFLFPAFCIAGFSCSDDPTPLPGSHHHIQPQYDLVSLHPTNDSIRFELFKETYNSISLVNIFTRNNTTYISFYDERSNSLNIYDFQTKSLVRRIAIKDVLKGRKLFKTTAFIKNFDTIFITNQEKVYLSDSSGNIKNSIEFLDSPPYSWAHFENTNPPILRNNQLFAGVRPYVKTNSLSALKQWKVIYQFDLQNKKSFLHYNLPPIYRNNYYSYQFLDYSYCVNNDGNLVFSFPADTSIYETDLAEYHRSYLGKSSLQHSEIRPVKKEQVKDTDSSFKSYVTQDSYGPIYFDSFNKKYLRVVKSAVSENDFRQKNMVRNYRFLILNDKFRIIGESPIGNGISYSMVFFKDGEVYARTNVNDEYAIHFIKLAYNKTDTQQIPITKK